MKTVLDICYNKENNQYLDIYLPDADDGVLQEETAGTDILKVKVKIGKSKVKKNKPE